MESDIPDRDGSWFNESVSFFLLGFIKIDLHSDTFNELVKTINWKDQINNEPYVFLLLVF